jgi:predicted CXXCH cytochrome family protein
MIKIYNRGYYLLLLVFGFVAFFCAKAYSDDKENLKFGFVEVNDDKPLVIAADDTKKEEEKPAKKSAKKKKKKAAKILQEGDKLFSFDIKGLNNKQVNLDNYLGKKIIILKFGSIYCSSCISSIPKLASIQSKYKKHVQIVEVNLDIYGRGRVRKFYDSLKGILNYPVVVDKGLKVSRQYGVTSLPTNIVIDKDGVIKYIARGYSEEEADNLDDVINNILGKKDIIIAPKRKDVINIMMPLNITKTFQNEIYVVGRISTPGVKIEMTLNGGSKQSIKATKEMFYFRTNLSLGSNYIEVKIPSNDTVEDTKAVVIFREEKFSASDPVPFPEYKFHTEDNESLCTECHDLVPPVSEDGEAPVMITKSCLKCHGEMVSDKYVHGPISVGGCLPCHEAGSTPNRYELKAKRAALCYICHFDKKEELEKANLHGPMAAGICVLCHNPHSAPYKYQLQRWGGELCFFCHSDMRRFQMKKHQHPPYKNGECTKCHGPHSSESKEFFLQKIEITDLCFSCHKEEDLASHRHKAGIVPTRVKLPPTRKVDEKGRLLCITCHNPHGDDGEKMLPENTCAACHAQNIE